MNFFYEFFEFLCIFCEFNVVLICSFFNTGDIVTYDADKREIKVIDRAKNMFKLAQGTFVSPEALEGVYTGSPFVEQAYVYAEPDKEFVLAVVVVGK